MLTLPYGFFKGTSTPAYADVYSVIFDGVNDYINFGTGLNSYFEIADAFSISAWIRFSASSNETVISSNSLSYRGWQIRVVAGNIVRFLLTKDGSTYILQDSSALSLNTWYHVVATKDTGNTTGDINLYINGVLDNNPSSGGTVDNISGGQAIYIGAQALGNMFTGNIDEVSVYNSELSAANAVTLYNGGTPADISGLSPLGWWKMGDPGGTAEYPTMVDSGSSSTDGTMVNMTSSDIVAQTP